MELPKSFIDIEGQFVLFRNLTYGKNALGIWNLCIIPNCAPHSWHGKGCYNIWKGYQWIIITSSCMSMKLWLRNGECVDCSIMFPSPRVICPLSVIMTWRTTTTMPNINFTNRSGSVNGTTAKSGGASPSTNGQGPLSTFNPFVDFFWKLWKNHKGV